jgi:hypothetical protein
MALIFFAGLLLLQAVSSVITAPAPEEVLPIYASGFQHHIQDNFGGYNYGYSNKDSAKEEIRHPDGSVVGSYSYVDANNVLQTVNYVSDDVLGFRVAATNLPQGDSIDAFLCSLMLQIPNVFLLPLLLLFSVASATHSCAIKIPNFFLSFL